jgi:hypothetical protein
VRSGYNAPSGDAVGGLIYDIEPGFRIGYYQLLFVRIERQKIFSNFKDNWAEYVYGGSISLGTQYYFLDRKNFRVYAGIGVGTHIALYSFDKRNTIGSVSVNETIVFVDQNYFEYVFYPRIGFDLGHFNFLIDYNFIGKQRAYKETNIYHSFIGFDLTEKSEEFDFNHSYISIKIGISIWGGLK